MKKAEVKMDENFVNTKEVTLAEKTQIKDKDLFRFEKAKNTINNKEGWVILHGKHIVVDKLFETEKDAKLYVKNNPIWMACMIQTIADDYNKKN